MIDNPATQSHQLVAFFWRSEDLRHALDILQALNFDTKGVVLGSHATTVSAADEGLPAFGDPVADWCAQGVDEEAAAVAGGGIGGVLGAIAGLGLLSLPTVGPWLLSAGPVAIALETTLPTLTGAAIGESLAAATQKNLADDERASCEQMLEKGYLMLLARSDAYHIHKAAQQLKPLATHLRTRQAA